MKSWAAAPKSRFRVPFDGSFDIRRAPTSPPKKAPRKKGLKRALAGCIEAMEPLQRRLYADDRHAVLLVFQALDAAGKDGTIRAVTTGLNPAGFQVHSFKAPSIEELDHDFLWRIWRRLPQRGRIGVFNRSHYEETLVVRVHPEFLDGQRLPRRVSGNRLWTQRFESIRAMERHLALNGTVILKFWLNVSPDEQRRRLLDRIEDHEANWKFSAGDLAERKLWKAYLKAYEQALRATSRPWAPWYAIPADNKPYMRWAVADILHRCLRGLDLHYPEVSERQRAEMEQGRAELLASTEE